MCESFFASLECELIDRTTFPTRAEARLAVLIPAVILVAVMVSALATVTPSGIGPLDTSVSEATTPANREIEKLVAEMKATEKELEQQMEEVQAQELEIQRQIEVIEPIEIDEEAITRIETAMLPHLERIEEIEIEMEPLHHRMEHLGDRLDNAIADEVAGRLKSHLSAVTGPGAPFREAARRIIESARVRIQNDVSALENPFSENREVLQDLFASHRIGAEETFDDTVTAAAKDLEDLRISVK